MTFKRCSLILIALACLALLCAGALSETTDFAYPHAVLVFQAPRDAELTYSESTPDSYFQTLYCPGSGETIMSGAFSSSDEAAAKIESLFGEAASAVQYNDALEAVGGRFARWGSFTAGTGESASFVNVVTIYAERPFLFVSVMPTRAYWGGESGEGFADLVFAQIASLEIFDPAASLFVEFEDEALPADQPFAADLTLSADGVPLLLNLFADVTDFTLSAVTLDSDGRLAPGEELFYAPALACGDVLRVRVLLSDTLPALAVSYALPDGGICLRYVADSAIDGTLMLIED